MDAHVRQHVIDLYFRANAEHITLMSVIYALERYDTSSSFFQGPVRSTLLGRMAYVRRLIIFFLLVLLLATVPSEYYDINL